MEKEIRLMKGNEALAIAAIRYGADAYFGYPITPQSEVLETLMAEQPWETTGMVVLQAESEVASINMVYGAAGTGKVVLTSSSSPGISLMCEGLSYIAASELPALVINVSRGGPGLGTIQPSQADYFQATKGGGHGDYHFIVLAPSSVQEMCDFVGLGWDLAFKYRTPAMILADGVVGQMMEKVVLPPQRPRLTDEEVRKRCPWAATGRTPGRARNVITSLELDSARWRRTTFDSRQHTRKLRKTKCVSMSMPLTIAIISSWHTAQSRVSARKQWRWHARKESKSESSVQSRCGLSRMQRLSVWQNAQKAC